MTDYVVIRTYAPGQTKEVLLYTGEHAKKNAEILFDQSKGKWMDVSLCVLHELRGHYTSHPAKA